MAEMSETPPVSFRALLLAVAGSALAILVLFVGIYLLSDRQLAPSTYLPQAATVAVFHRVQASELRRFSPLFPILNTVPATTEPVHVALVRLPSGALGWAMFPLRKYDTLTLSPQAGTPLRDGVVTSGQPELAALLAGTKDRLSASVPYATLKGKFSTEPWGFIDTQGLPQTFSARDRRSAALLGIDRYVGLSLQAGTPTLMAYNPRAAALSATIATPPVPANAGQTLFVSRPRGLWTALRASVTPEEQMILDARAATLVRASLGSDVSLSYDLLPLFERGMLLAAGPRSATGTAFVLRGTAPSAETFAAIAARLHRERAAGGGRLIEKTFDPKQGFSFRGLVADDAASDPLPAQHGSWTVLATRDSTGRLLITAQRDAAFVFSNDASFMEPYLKDDDASAWLLPRGALAAGQTSPAWLQSALAPLSSSLARALLPGMFDGDATLRWSVTREGSTLVFRTETPPVSGAPSAERAAGSGSQTGL